MHVSSAASALNLCARMTRDLRCQRGERGTLWESWADSAAVAYLRHLAGMDTPAPGDDAGGFSWHVEGRWLVLDQAMLGVVVRGVDSIALAEGLEDLGTFASDVAPTAVAEAERTGLDLEACLPRALQRVVMIRRDCWAPGVSYRLAEGVAEARMTPPDVDAFREAQAAIEVQDHRNVIPIRPVAR